MSEVQEVAASLGLTVPSSVQYGGVRCDFRIVLKGPFKGPGEALAEARREVLDFVKNEGKTIRSLDRLVEVFST